MVPVASRAAELLSAEKLNGPGRGRIRTLAQDPPDQADDLEPEVDQQGHERENGKGSHVDLHCRGGQLGFPKP